MNAYFVNGNSASLCPALFAVQIRWVDHDPSVETNLIKTAAFIHCWNHLLPFPITKLDVCVVIGAHIQSGSKKIAKLQRKTLPAGALCLWQSKNKEHETRKTERRRPTNLFVPVIPTLIGRQSSALHPLLFSVTSFHLDLCLRPITFYCLLLLIGYRW